MVISNEIEVATIAIDEGTILEINVSALRFQLSFTMLVVQ